MLCDRKVEDRWVCERRFAIPRTVDTKVEDALEEDEDEEEDEEEDVAREYTGGSHGGVAGGILFCSSACALGLPRRMAFSTLRVLVLGYWEENMNGANVAQASSLSKRRS